MAYNDQSPPIPLLAADVDSGQEEEESETYLLKVGNLCKDLKESKGWKWP